MDSLFTLLPPLTIFAAMLCTLLGGFIKGTVGFAMPLVMISSMGVFIDPQIVVAGIIVPILATNILQVWRAGVGTALAALGEFWRYIAIVCAAILVTAQFLTVLPANVLFLMLGLITAFFSLIQLVGWRLSIPPHRRRVAEWLIGLVSGSIGGLSGTWGPPTVLFLLAMETPKAKMMAVQGLIFGAGSVMLLLGHTRSGVLNSETLPFSALLVLPAFAGMWLGFKLGDKLDQERFRKMTLLVLVIAGLNLIRRGLFI